MTEVRVPPWLVVCRDVWVPEQAPGWAFKLAERLYCDSNEWDGMSTGPLRRTLAWVRADPEARRAQLETILAIAHREVQPRSLRLSLRREAVANLVEGA